MGIRSDIQGDLAEAMDGDLADVVAVFDFLEIVDNSTYDVDEDTNNPTKEKSPSRGIFSEFKQRDIDGINIRAHDQKVIVNGLDVSIAPLTGMKIQLASGKQYRIVKPNPVMGGETTPIIFNMQVRDDASAEVQ